MPYLRILLYFERFRRARGFLSGFWRRDSTSSCVTSLVTSPMDLLQLGDWSFNVDNGYLEGLVRGFKAGILTQADYLNLCQCETLEGKTLAKKRRTQTDVSPRADIKLHLQSTSYGNFLQNEPSPLNVSTIDDKMKELLVVEFEHMRNQAVQPLAQFLDFMTYSYMIDNIVLLISGTLHERPVSELIANCHPLGSFEQMESVSIATTPADLFNAVLIDTPLGRGPTSRD